ncbi:MAG TPA: hypothetical protein PLL10_05600, partial [Elusimicrobiales bacterium]|nr:hypothetical protein [Elusimicrobiales bacterium]
GFGSMPPSKRLAVVIMELARSGKHRFVVQKSTVAPLLTHNTPGIFLIDSAPHSKLFPLLSAAIHHGGSGTTHTAARAAIPQIIVPYSFDQYYWGDMAWRAGIAPKPITRRSLSSENLATALLHAPLFKRKAGELALAIQHRNGLNKALDHIENILMERA